MGGGWLCRNLLQEYCKGAGRERARRGARDPVAGAEPPLGSRCQLRVDIPGPRSGIVDDLLTTDPFRLEAGHRPSAHRRGTVN